jgi:hypothetical protein
MQQDRQLFSLVLIPDQNFLDIQDSNSYSLPTINILSIVVSEADAGRRSVAQGNSGRTRNQ